MVVVLGRNVARDPLLLGFPRFGLTAFPGAAILSARAGFSLTAFSPDTFPEVLGERFPVLDADCSVGGILSSMTVKHLMKLNFVTDILKWPSLACVA